jgi:hypothetical protein
MTRLALVVLGVSLVGTLGCGGDDKSDAADAAAGAGGSAGTAGMAGTGGMAGTAGRAGTGGTAGSAGGTAGTAGGAGVDGGIADAAKDAPPTVTDVAAGMDGGITDAARDVLPTVTDVASSAMDAPTSASTKITSAGGTLTAGGATLTIPAGALGADTTITMTASAPADTLPDKSSIVGQVYDLGPNGTMFTKAVALTLPLALAAPAGKLAVVSWLDAKTNTWMDLNTTINGSTVTGQTTHFTLFAARHVASNGVSACVWEGACAGNLVGTWDITDACGKNVNGICGLADTASFVETLTGSSATLAVIGDKYTLSGTVAVRALYSGACMTKTLRSMSTDCSDVPPILKQFLMVTATCKGSAATGCDCTFAQTVDEKGTVSGNQLVRDTNPVGETKVSEACAKDTTIQVRMSTTKMEVGEWQVSTTVISGKKK